MLHENSLYRKYIKCNYWLLICIAKNNFKDDSMEIWFINLSDDAYYHFRYDWFCAPGSHVRLQKSAAEAAG